MLSSIAGNHAHAERGAHLLRLVHPVGRVVVGERHRRHAMGMRQLHELGRREPAVRDRAMQVQVERQRA